VARPTHLPQSPRLEAQNYLGALVAHLIFVTRERRPHFSYTKLAETCLEALQSSREKHKAIIHAYCVMPDHMHVLVEMTAGMSLQKFARLFKQLSGYQLKATIGDFAWQTSYYDHMLRREEAILDIANYIWDNPVKEGLAQTPAEFPLSGPREFLEAAVQV
jgi:putative transposase